MHVLLTEKENKTAVMTVSFCETDHKFEVWKEGDSALVRYSETLSWRGIVRVSEPDESVFKSLMTSDKMTTLLNRWRVSNVKRAAPTP
jgi:hypothetical protein